MQMLLDKVHAETAPENLRLVRAVEFLEHCHSNDAGQLLTTYARAHRWHASRKNPRQPCDRWQVSDAAHCGCNLGHSDSLLKPLELRAGRRRGASPVLDRGSTPADAAGILFVDVIP